MKLPGKSLRDPEATLFTSHAFWFAIIVPILSSASLILIASCLSELSPDFSAAGMRNFYELFKLPLALAGLSIPCAALVASHLRSIQTADQIKQQASQMQRQASQDAFSNYLEHRKQFLSFYDTVKPFKSELKLPSWKLYDVLFPEAHDAIFTINSNVKRIIKDIDDVAKELTEVVAKLDVHRTYEPGLTAMKAGTIAHNIYSLLGKQITNLSMASSVPMNRMHNLGEELLEITTGLVTCANFHNTEIAESEYTRTLNNLYQLIDSSDYRARCERIRETMLECLTSDLEPVDNPFKRLPEIAEPISEMLRLEAHSKLGKPAEPVHLDQEVRWVINYELPEELKLLAWNYLPKSLREATEDLPDKIKANNSEQS